MTSTGSEVFLLQCSLCGAKISQSGTVVGGHSSCNPHKYGPIVPVGVPIASASTSPRSRGIVYPSDKERNWLRLVDENKLENEQHTAKLSLDIKTLNKNKTEAMELIAAKIQTLRVKLDERQDALEQELTLAHNERYAKMQENIELLKKHKLQNMEAKDNSEDLLVGNKQVKDREQIIVGQCEEVIHTTPNLKYIETELRYTFKALEAIERRLSNFGVLHSKPLNSGLKCIFQSALDARNPVLSPKPQEVRVPELQLRNTAFDEKKQRVKLGFKVRHNAEQNKDIDIEVMPDYLYIHVLCQQEMDDDGKTDELKPIYEENVPLKDCKLNQNRTKYELYVQHKFNAGITVEFKIQAKFVSPDEEKYVSGEGKWSRAQSAEIPEEDNSAIFNIVLNGRSKRLSMDGDDAALTKFDRFEKKFMKKFGLNLKQNEKLMLRTKDGVVLNEKSKLRTFASDEFVIEGYIQRPQAVEPAPQAFSKGPQAMSDKAVANMASGHNARQSIAAEVFISPRNHVAPPKEAKAKAAATPKQNKKGDVKGKAKAVGPKQIASIAVFKDTKKRVVLKNNPKKEVYEYTMNSLKDKILKKFQKTGLKGQFALKTDDGNVIEMDEHIVKYLVDFKGEIKVISQ